MSKFKVLVTDNNNKHFIDVDRTVRDVATLQRTIVDALNLPKTPTLLFCNAPGSTKPLYQDFHLTNALVEAERSGARFFELILSDQAPPPVTTTSTSASASTTSTATHKPTVSAPSTPTKAPLLNSSEAKIAAQSPSLAALASSGGAGASVLSPGASPARPKFCGECGARVGTGKFCGECGNRLPEPSAPSTPTATSPTTTSAAASPIASRTTASATSTSTSGSSSAISRVGGRNAGRIFSTPYPNASNQENACAACGNHLGFSAVVNALERKWHKECFVCSACSSPLLGTEFTSQDGLPICSPCFDEHFGKRCVACSNIIKERYVSVENNFYHPACFVCSQCKSGFDAGYVKVGTEFKCRACAIKG